MTKLRERFAFDLANTFAGNAEFASDFLKRARMTVFKAITQRDDLALALSQTIKHLGKLLLQHGERRGIGRNHGGIVLDEVAQLGILFLADGRFERNRLLADLLNLAHALGGKPHLVADFLGRWLAAKFLQKLTLNAHKLVDGFDHMHRDANGARLVGNGAVMAWRIHQVAYVENLKPFV